MKKFVLFSFLLFGMSAMAQVVIPPHHTQDAFKQSHPDANRLVWTMENGNYKATYYDQSKKMRNTIFDANDVVLRNEYELPTSDVPAIIADYYAKSKDGQTAEYRVFMVVDKDGNKSYYTIQNEVVTTFDQDGKVK